MSTATSSKLEIIDRMRSAAYRADWDTFQTFLTPDVVARYAAAPPITGPGEVARSQQWMMEEMMRLTDARILGVHETDDVLVVEYDITGLRLRDDRTFVFPCVDIYRFEGEQVAEWHVYPLFADFAVGSALWESTTSPASTQAARESSS